MRQNSYDPFGAELRRFAETLDRRNFKALSTGLGVVAVSKKTMPMQAFAPKTVQPEVPTYAPNYAHSYKQAIAQPEKFNPPKRIAPSPQPAYVPPMPQQQVVTKHIGQKQETRPVVLPYAAEPVATPKYSAAPIPRQSSLLSRFFIRIMRMAAAHLIDVTAVFMSFVAALFIAAYAFAPRAPHSHALIDALAAWAPVKLIMGMGVLYFLVMIYALFSVYWVFLKLAVGATLGHTLTAFAIPPETQKTE